MKIKKVLVSQPKPASEKSPYYDIAELGLSVEAAKNLYTGRVNTEVVNLLLENARFAELTSA